MYYSLYNSTCWKLVVGLEWFHRGTSSSKSLERIQGFEKLGLHSFFFYCKCREALWEGSVLPKNTTQWPGQISNSCLFTQGPVHLTLGYCFSRIARDISDIFLDDWMLHFAIAFCSRINTWWNWLDILKCVTSTAKKVTFRISNTTKSFLREKMCTWFSP